MSILSKVSPIIFWCKKCAYIGVRTGNRVGSVVVIDRFDFLGGRELQKWRDEPGVDWQDDTGASLSLWESKGKLCSVGVVDRKPAHKLPDQWERLAELSCLIAKKEAELSWLILIVLNLRIKTKLLEQIGLRRKFGLTIIFWLPFWGAHSLKLLSLIRGGSALTLDF